MLHCLCYLCAHVPSQHPGTVSAVVAIPSTQLLMSTCWGGSTSITDLVSGAVAASLPSLPGGVLAAAACGSSLALAGADRAVLLFDLRNVQQPVCTTVSPLLHQTTTVSFSASGAAVAFGSVGGHIKAQPTNSLAQDQAVGTASVKSLTCHRLDKASGRCTQRGGVSFPVNALQWCPSSSAEPLLVSGGGDGSLTVWDTSQGRSTNQRENLGAAVTAAAWTPDGAHLLYATGEDGAQASTSDGVKQQQPAALHLMRAVQ